MDKKRKINWKYCAQNYKVIDVSIYFFKDFIYLFLERGREGEKHQRVVASHMPPTGDLACKQPRHVP